MRAFDFVATVAEAESFEAQNFHAERRLAETRALSYETLAVFFFVVALIQISAAFWLFHRSAYFIGTYNIEKLKREKGIDTNLVGTKQLPLSRFICVLISLVAFVEYIVKAGQAFDLSRNRPVGISTTNYSYWGYLAGCPLIMYDWAETIRVDGVVYFAAAVLAAMVIANATEFIDGTAHWALLACGLSIAPVIVWRTGGKARATITVCRKHAISRKAGNYLLLAGVTMSVGWGIFPITWVLRDDLDPSHGVFDVSIADIMHGVGDIVSKPLFAFFLIVYRQHQEDLHLRDIIRELGWAPEDLKKLVCMLERNKEGKAPPPEVIIATVPALLDHLLQQSEIPKSARVKRALVQQRLHSRMKSFRQSGEEEKAEGLRQKMETLCVQRFKSEDPKSKEDEELEVIASLAVKETKEKDGYFTNINEQEMNRETKWERGKRGRSKFQICSLIYPMESPT
uniref:Uncharacterized protein n=1 Tax=Chromera velia CCMP2878 TaxID=1169474 RepID=A0A0G4GWU5_9ALVE|eukprot:Cvel_23720.t1-p1 / transcript=Cvel_23720.t1 / gene=Cvel_23720 / organism=Chromera_velia_CCMP2878 / gene_product=hypothetical protein / transcript_product=hypothetical protein / location=Cvel_scaffold2478:24230-25920(+) / protein_length=454 / sequence_SO=supercontig / SO=protein_coding / is_pseudo=false